MKTTILPLLTMISLPFLFSCNKKEIKTSPVEFYLMDSPAGYDSVNIHIKKIEAKVVADSTRWFSLNTTDTTVDLLNFQDSTTLMMAHDIVPLGSLKEIRFILGTDNTVVLKGVSHPLQIAGTDSPVLTIPVDKNLNEAFNGFILDFDASRSIVQDRRLPFAASCKVDTMTSSAKKGMKRKNWIKKCLLFMPVLLYSLALLLLPANIIARCDPRLLSALVAQKRTLINLRKQLRMRWKQFSSFFFIKNQQKQSEA
ncbi:MAG TPA: DUF4382 domain-containing protein [Chitinophagaceae bacterium]